MTDVSVTTAVERIARVIAAEAISDKGEGNLRSVETSAIVEAAWRDEVPRALAVLRTLREPSAAMVAAGDAAEGGAAAIWDAMARAAIAEYHGD